MISKRLHPASFSNVNAQLAQIGIEWKTDFLHTYAATPWTYGAIAGGQNFSAVAVAKHPGIANMVTSETANSGGRFCTDTSSIMLIGAEKTVICFNASAYISDILVRMGFHSTVDHTAPVDGAYLKIESSNIAGVCSSASNTTITDTTYTITTNVWYRAEIIVNADATAVSFSLFADDSDTLLWTSTINTNVPKNKRIAHSINATMSNPLSVKSALMLDFVSLSLPNRRRVS